MKSEEDKLKRDDDPMIIGPVKLSNGFEDKISSIVSNEETNEKTSGGDQNGGEKNETSTNTKSVTDVVVQDAPKDAPKDAPQDAPQEAPQDATFSANERKGKEAINDLNIALQDATSSADGKKGKEKVVEQVVQVTLQDRIASAATRNINTPVWFRLVASNQENTIAPLPQISASSLRIKNSNMELSFIKKYLVKKLDLKSENEVELYLQNEPLDSSIMLSDLWQYWISTKKDVGVMKVKVGSSGADYIMVINYGRKSEQAV